MTDRVPADDPSIETIRGELTRRGATSRLAIRLPADTVPTETVVRVVLDGSKRFAQPERRPDGKIEIPGIYGSPAIARDPDAGADDLRQWVTGRELGVGRTVHIDEIEAGHRYGLRGPGEDAVYRDAGRPKDSLASIAEQLDGEDRRR